MSEREQFGPTLRRERERRGISLRDIATQTKISVPLLEAMERNDFTRWPAGIFRRSFVRSYAQVVGLDHDRVLDDFLRLFPLDGEAPPRAAATAAVDARQDGESASGREPRAPRTATLLRGLAILLIAAGAVAVGVVVGRPYLGASVGTAVAGVSLSLGRLSRRRPRGSTSVPVRATPMPPPAPVASAPRQEVARHATAQRSPAQRRSGERPQPPRRGRARRHGRQRPRP